MSTTTTAADKGWLGHPRQLWMLFMTEFWERFSFYGMRWALTLYIVAQFFGGDASGEAYASRTYGSYLALVYATAIFGGLIADRVIGYQRSILLGAVVTAVGLVTITIPNREVFLFGLALVICGNGLFKPNISTLVGKLYPPGDPRRDRGFTIFYMGINAGSFVAPLATNWLASVITKTPLEANYKAVFWATGVGMVISGLWFAIGRRQLAGVVTTDAEQSGPRRLLYVVLGLFAAVPATYLLLSRAGADVLQFILTGLFIALAVMILIEAIREGKVQRDKAAAMLIMFAFNVLFWMFFEQAGSSFNFLAQNIVNRDFGGWEFPVGWFQSVNPAGILVLGPVMTLLWAGLSAVKLEPAIPGKFGLGLIGNALGFLVLMYALQNLVTPDNKIPFWPLAACYVLQTVGELALSPIGLSMVSKLAPARYAGFAMGGWFLSTAIGNNLSGIFAGAVSGETGITVPSALHGFTFSFYLLLGSGVVLFVAAPFIAKLMHGTK